MAVAGGVLLVVADLSTLFTVKAGREDPAATIKTVSGHAQHSFGFLVLGLAALVMAYGAARRNSRPAMAAMGAIGVAAVLIALIGDLPDATSAGSLKGSFDQARTVRGSGFYLETLGAVLLVIAGGAGLVLSAPARPRLRRERPERRERPTPAS